MATVGTLGPSLKNKEVLDKAKEQITKAIEGRHKPYDIQNGESTSTPTVPATLGDVDVTLTYMELYELPENLIDIIKDEVTRMSLHHNRLTGLSALSSRIHECSNLRYLVMRENKIHDFPTCILSLPNLELLDLKRNKLAALPEDLDRLTQLKFVSVTQNHLRRVPVCIAKMNLLTKFEASDNPIEFPPKSEWVVSTAKNGEERLLSASEQELVYQEETIKLKRYLQNYRRDQMRREVDGQSSDGTLDTPKASRRKTSGRFPIKPSVSGIEHKSDPVPPSPRLPKPPPLPVKAQGRGLNQPINAAVFRPGVSPFITTNERNRSNSESGVQTSVREKRMGFHVKQLGQEKVDIENSNRLSHLRGLSHGSALQGNTVPLPNNGVPNPPATADPNIRRPEGSRRLSSLPEGKRKSRAEDPVLNLARGLLYSLLQIFNPIKHLIMSLGTVGAKRTGLEAKFVYSWNMLEELNTRLSRNQHTAEDEDEGRNHSLRPIQDTCRVCVETFEQLLVGLQGHIHELVLQTSQEYIRTLMHLLYASLIEIRISCSKMATQPSARTKIQASSRDNEVDDLHRPKTSLRVTHETNSFRNGGMPPSRENGKLAPMRTAEFGMKRSKSDMSLNYADSGLVAPALSRSSTLASTDEEESQQFERIWGKVDVLCRSTYEALRHIYTLTVNIRVYSGDNTSHEEQLAGYDQINDRCRRALAATDNLKYSLRNLQVKDPALKNQFWATVTAFTKEYVLFVAKVRENSRTLPGFPDEVKRLLKPVQQGHKDLGRAIHASPWSQYATLSQRTSRSNSVQNNTNAALVQAASAIVPRTRPVPPLGLQTRGDFPPPNPSDPMSSVSNVSSNGNSNSVMSSGYVTPLPATPMSAALGPAAVATLPVLQDSQCELNAGGPIQQPSGGSFDRSRSASQR